MGNHKPYNGHKDRNHWDVALWIANEERLYRRAVFRGGFRED